MSEGEALPNGRATAPAQAARHALRITRCARRGSSPTVKEGSAATHRLPIESATAMIRRSDHALRTPGQ
jgi:hypothetical protein